MCEVSNLQTSPNSKKHPHFWGTFGELKLKKALQISVTPFSAEREGVFFQNFVKNGLSLSISYVLKIIKI